MLVNWGEVSVVQLRHILINDSPLQLQVNTSCKKAFISNTENKQRLIFLLFLSSQAIKVHFLTSTHICPSVSSHSVALVKRVCLLIILDIVFCLWRTKEWFFKKRVVQSRLRCIKRWCHSRRTHARAHAQPCHFIKQISDPIKRSPSLYWVTSQQANQWSAVKEAEEAPPTERAPPGRE